MRWTNQELRLFLAELKDIMAENKSSLAQLDSVAGDGDLGFTMSAGFAAASALAEESIEQDIGKLLYQAGKALGKAVPSSMGTLMSAGLMNAGKALANRKVLDSAGLLLLLEAWQKGVETLGKAKVGEKTFLDGFVPAVERLRLGGQEPALYKEAAEAARQGAEHTVGMLAVHGRAAIRGELSRELLDPGAVVGSLVICALFKTVQRQ